MELKNKNTQEVATVQRLHVNNDGQIIYKDYNMVGRAPAARIFANNSMLADTMIKDRDGWPVLRLSSGWEIVVKGNSRKKAEKSQRGNIPLQMVDYYQRKKIRAGNGSPRRKRIWFLPYR